MEMDNTPHVRELPTPRMIFGGGLVLLGVILTLDRMRLVDADYVLRFWPVLMIAVGAQMYFRPAAGPQRGARRVNGLIWMGLGAWLLLNSLGAVRVRFWELIWPVMLILVGANLVMQTLRGSGATDDAADRVSIFAVLSGVKRTSSAAPFRGGDMTGFMGGGQLDLRQAIIPPGEVATIEVFAVMAGFDLQVPPHWVVSMPVVPIVGGIEDKRVAPVSGEIIGAPDSVPPRLVLRGFLMMGGITLRD